MWPIPFQRKQIILSFSSYSFSLVVCFQSVRESSTVRPNMRDNFIGFVDFARVIVCYLVWIKGNINSEKVWAFLFISFHFEPLNEVIFCFARSRYIDLLICLILFMCLLFPKDEPVYIKKIWFIVYELLLLGVGFFLLLRPFSQRSKWIFNILKKVTELNFVCERRHFSENSARD